LTYVFFADGEKDIDSCLTFRLIGAHSSVDVFGFTFGNMGISSISICLMHQNENTSGCARIKSILGGTAIGRIKGMIKIAPNAPWAHGYFSHNSLLMSASARIETSPSLEIETNEVGASHAATIGRLDDAILFYLGSRGIEPAEAKRLVVASFMHEHISKIRDDVAREEVRIYLNRKIAKFL
jgi:Fe-S cluster assembly scaffold protein SufB